MQKKVKYSNRFNIPLKGFTARELDLLMYICFVLMDNGSDEITISFADITTALCTGRITSARTASMLGSMCSHLAQSITHSKITYENGKQCIDIVSMFDKFIISEDTCTLTVSLNPYFHDTFNDLSEKWTEFDLDEFIGLRSRYSKLLFRYLKEKRCLGGRCSFSLDIFRECLDIPDSYTTGQIEQKVLLPAMEELSGSFDGLQVERDYVITRKRGRPLVNGYKFTFRPEKKYSSQDYIRNAVHRSSGALSGFICPKCGKELMIKTINGMQCYCHFDYASGPCRQIYTDTSFLS